MPAGRLKKSGAANRQSFKVWRHRGFWHAWTPCANNRHLHAPQVLCHPLLVYMYSRPRRSTGTAADVRSHAFGSSLRKKSPSLTHAQEIASFPMRCNTFNHRLQSIFMPINIPCLVCGGLSHEDRFFSADFLRKQYEQYFQSAPPQVVFGDYSEMHCEQCDLHFFHPPLPGNEAFYEWIARQSGYYPELRWEWIKVIEAIKAVSAEEKRLLEIGCGAGDFLALLKLQNAPTLGGIGIDTTESSVKKCQERGVEVFRGTLLEFAKDPACAQMRFDAVVAFHCLEHVPDPKGFVREMAHFLKPGGVIFLSTPYSPTNLEILWFDPLNHPPHHLSRWNEASYRALAQQLGMTIRFSMSSGNSGTLNLARTLKLKYLARYLHPLRVAVLRALARHPFTYFKEKKRRTKILVDGQPLSDTVLVELRFR